MDSKKSLEDQVKSRTLKLSAEIAERKQVEEALRAYLDSDRRLAFNEHGIFRYYPELDLS